MALFGVHTTIFESLVTFEDNIMGVSGWLGNPSFLAFFRRGTGRLTALAGPFGWTTIFITASGRDTSVVVSCCLARRGRKQRLQPSLANKHGCVHRVPERTQ